MTQRIALVGHRVAAAHPTGIGRYYVETTAALARTGDPARVRYTIASTTEPTDPTWVVPPLEHRSLGGPRKARAVAWGLVGRPRVDRALGNPDLVHLLHPWAAMPTRRPLVVTVHDLMPLLHPTWFKTMERWSHGRGLARARDDADLIICDSQHAAGLMTSELGVTPDRMRIIPFGVDDAFRARASDAARAETCERHGVEPGRYVIAVGAVSERKNISVLLQALARIDPAVLGPIALLVTGPPGHGADAIAAEVEQLGLTTRVRFAGFVSDADLHVLLGSSLALVFPSRDEGFGVVPLEAMAAGVPVIASRAASLPEVVGPAGVLVDPDDADGWAAAIHELATDPVRHAELVAAGDERQIHFTWERTAIETRAVHDEVLR